jgi:hypothetical protein
MKRDIILVASALVLFLVLAGIGFMHARDNAIQISDPLAFARKDFVYHHDFWTKTIDAHGPEAAYRAFKKANADIPTGRQHVLAHVFGTELYETAGLDGFTTCDSTFGFGCYHGYMVAAVKERGSSSIRSLDGECVKSFGQLGTGCQHGIGHGILEYLGHKNLTDALSLCAETTERAPLIGCSAGVYMEYFVQTGLLATASSTGPLPFDIRAPYGPCDSVPERYQPACYWALPDWWNGGMEDAKLSDMITLCSALPEAARKPCYLGIGELAPTMGKFDVKATAALCDSIATGEARVFCRAGAAWNLFARKRGNGDPRSLCDGLAEGDRAACLVAADYTNGLDMNAP